MGRLMACNMKGHGVLEEKEDLPLIGKAAWTGVGTGVNIGEGVIETAPEGARDESEGIRRQLLQSQLRVGEILF